MYKHEYKTGDRVVIKPWKLMEGQYGLYARRYINTALVFIPDAEACLKGTDRVIELGEATQGRFKGTGRLKEYEISTDMILGYAFEYGEEIEVSDDGEKWQPKIFSGYDSFNTNLPIRANTVGHIADTVGWKYARPVQKKIAVRIFDENNEDITESISKETKKKLLQELN